MPRGFPRLHLMPQVPRALLSPCVCLLQGSLPIEQHLLKVRALEEGRGNWQGFP